MKGGVYMIDSFFGSGLIAISYRSPCGTSTGCAATAQYELWISKTRGSGTPGWLVGFLCYGGKRRLKNSTNSPPGTSTPYASPQHLPSGHTKSRKYHV